MWARFSSFLVVAIPHEWVLAGGWWVLVLPCACLHWHPSCGLRGFLLRPCLCPCHEAWTWWCCHGFSAAGHLTCLVLIVGCSGVTHVTHAADAVAFCGNWVRFLISEQEFQAVLAAKHFVGDILFYSRAMRPWFSLDCVVIYFVNYSDMHWGVPLSSYSELLS